MKHCVDFKANIFNITNHTTYSIKGDPAYLAPEVLLYNNYSKANDVYAFAFVAYEMKTSNVPFPNNMNSRRLEDKIEFEEIRPEFDKEIPIYYCELIEICWSQDPNKRPSFKEQTINVNKDAFLKYVNLKKKV